MLIIGRIQAARGLQGDVVAQSLTDFPERFSSGKLVFIGGIPFPIARARPSKGNLLLKLEGVDTRAAAEALRGKLLEVPEEDPAPLAEDQYYYHQVLGMEVWTTAGDLLGKIVEILPYPANDVYVVRQGGREILIPAIEDVVKKVEPGTGRTVIQPLPGLL